MAVSSTASGCRYRPAGRPHYGGIIERIVGTVMQRVHELPGTTFSNPAERGELRLRQAGGPDTATSSPDGWPWRWPRITARCTPRCGKPLPGAWAAGVARDGTPPVVVDRTGFLVDFLPVLRRRITRVGFVIDHVHYFGNVLKPWIARRDRLGRFVIRRDPRDISRVWVLDPDGAAYVPVPYRNVAHPAVSVWEHRQALVRLKQRGAGQVDEHALFAMIDQMRRITDEATKTTRRTRRESERRRHAPAAGASPPHPGRRPAAGRRWGSRFRRRRGSTTLSSGDRAADEPPLDLSHLHPAVRQAALLPADQRLAVIRADRWIGYPRASQALARLEALLAWPSRQRMPNMLLIGPTNNGKSMIIEKFRRAHPPCHDLTGNTSPCCAADAVGPDRHASTPPSWPRWGHCSGRGSA